MLNEYIIKDQETGVFSCTICGKENNHKFNLKKHVENIHFPGSISHPCKYCDHVFATKNMLNHHIAKYHSVK